MINWTEVYDTLDIIAADNAVEYYDKYGMWEPKDCILIDDIYEEDER